MGDEATGVMAWLRGERARNLGRAGLLGAGLGAGAVLAAVLLGVAPAGANGIVFPLGAMAFGFGMASWASVLLYGTTIERGARRTEMSENFSSDGAARAMGRLTLGGLGVMTGGSATTVIVTAVG